MGVEIEAKLKVDSLGQIEQRLGELDSEFVEEQLHMDHFFDGSGSTLTRTDRGLRLRRQSTDGGERYLLTYKGAKEKGPYKRRQEIEVEVGALDSARELLLELGFEQILVFEKKRRLWHVGGCEVALDHVPLLGSFVEIEGPDDERIAEVQSDLGLGDVPHIRHSYASMMDKKLREQETGS